MGKAARWLRGLLLGAKKPGAVGDPKPAKEKKRWGFARSFRDKEQQRKEGAVAVDEGRNGASYREGSRSYASSGASATAATAAPPPPPLAPVDDGNEQNKRAIAVAAATAVVAEAAVAAAQAAAAVVRLTSSGRGAGVCGAGRNDEERAAVKIQAAFRSYLARRALRALRGLVKLQALVRGHIVRKQAAETLRCMHALVRVQARARACRALSESRQPNKSFRHPHPVPPTPEKYEPAIRANSAKHDRSNTLKRNVSKPCKVDTIDLDRIQSSGWNWLDRWIEERYSDSREVSSRTGVVTEDEKNDKILEIDTVRPHSNSKRRNIHHQRSCSTLASDQNSRSFATVLDSPSKDSTTAQLSIPSPSSVDMQQSVSPLRFALEAGELCESPHFFSATSRPGSSKGGPFTPSKSECSRSFFSGYSDYPNYMANTQSSRAKVRSQSAPKQRPPEYEKSGSIKRLSIQGFGASGQPQSLSTQRSGASLHLKFMSKAYPGSGRLDRLGMPIRY